MPGVAPAHPGHGPTQISIANLAYQPQRVEIFTGDTVVWFWDGPDTDHSVTATEGQAEQFDSDPGGNPRHRRNDAFAHRFTQSGTFTYYCRTHPFMRGTVVVTGEPISDDVTAPAISALRARPARICARRTKKCRTTATRISFRLSEPAEVTGRVIGRLNKTVRRFRLAARDGTNAVRIRSRGLRRGLYRVVLTATDAAGNRSEPKTVRVRVR